MAGDNGNCQTEEACDDVVNDNKCNPLIQFTFTLTHSLERKWILQFKIP